MCLATNNVEELLALAAAVDVGLQAKLASTEGVNHMGVKVLITTTHKEGLVVGARSMPGNPYDGHTLAEALAQPAILSDAKPELAIVVRGCKGSPSTAQKSITRDCDAESRAARAR